MAPGTFPEPRGCPGCCSSQHPSGDPGRATALSVHSPSSPQPAQHPRGVPGDGAMLWRAHRLCNRPVSLRPADTPLPRWHPGEVLGNGCPVPPVPLRATGIQSGTGVCRCTGPAAHAPGKGPASASPRWNLGVTGHPLPLWAPELGCAGMGGLRFAAPKGKGFISGAGRNSPRAVTQQGAERAVPATGHLMAPEPEGDKEVSPQGAGWGTSPGYR